MEKFSTQIEYISKLVAFLLPFYIAGKAYNIIKNKNFGYINILTVIICAILVVIAYLFLKPTQRYFIISMIGVLVIVLFVVLGVTKIFNRN